MDNKRLTLIAVSFLAFFMYWGGTQLARAPKQGPLESESFFNYVIPKLKTFIPKFSLWDRKFVDRRKLAPKAANGSPKSVAQAAPSGTPVPTATPQPKPKAQAQATQVPAPKSNSNEFAVTPVDEDNVPFAEPFPENAGSGGLAGGPLPTDAPSPETLLGEWKMKILRNPTQDTMNELILEYQTGRLNKTVFYQIIEELMKDSNSDIQKLALYGLVATPSFDSFSLLLTQREHLAPDTTDMLRIALDAYSKNDRMDILNTALRSQNHVLILGAMPMIVKIGSRMTLWSADYSSLSDDRDRRGPTNRVPKKGLMQIIDTLKELEDGADHAIAQAARDTLNQLNYNPSTASRRD
jgi:hypothetical protein